MKPFQLVFFIALSFGFAAKAAQVGQVVVEEAHVYQYPQSGSKVIANLKRGETVPVSNLPTEGFFKAKLSSGEMGWLSGNDIHAGAVPSAKSGAAAAPPAEPVPLEPAPNTRMRRKPPQVRPKAEDDENAENDPADSPSLNGDHTRILFGFGFQNLSFAGLASNYEKVDLLNPGNNFGLELQFRISSWLHWALKADSFSGATGEQVISTGDTQTITMRNISGELGLVLTALQSDSIRFSLGAYLGAGSSLITIRRISASSGGETPYASVNPCGLVSGQLSFSIFRHLAIFGEGAYRYQQTQEFRTIALSGTVPNFKINYSGVFGRIGLELKL